MCHAFLSFIGIKLIYRAFNQFVSRKKLFWYGLLLLPSVGFWCSSILKESVLIFGIGLLYYSISKLVLNVSIKNVLLFLAASFLLLMNKPYAGLVIFSISFLWIVGKKTDWKIKSLILSLGCLLVICVTLLFAPSPLNLTEKVSYKQKDLNSLGKGGTFFINDSAFCGFEYDLINNFEMVDDTMMRCIKSCHGEYKLFGKYEFNKFNIEKSDKLYHHYLTQIPSTSYYEVELIDNSNMLLIKLIPSVMFNVLIRPFPWDNGSRLKIIIFFQNIALIIFLVCCFVKRNKNKLNEKWIILMLTISALFITVLVGWTTPIFGAAVRYKVPVDLFILIIGFILLKAKKNEKI
jgi:hypothetical protein